MADLNRCKPCAWNQKPMLGALKSWAPRKRGIYPGLIAHVPWGKEYGKGMAPLVFHTMSLNALLSGHFHYTSSVSFQFQTVWNWEWDTMEDGQIVRFVYLDMTLS